MKRYKVFIDESVAKDKYMNSFDCLIDCESDLEAIAYVMDLLGFMNIKSSMKYDDINHFIKISREGDTILKITC